MIITQTHKRRTFVGSMNVGTDLIEGLKSICVDNTIFCAQFTAVGYLRNVRMRRFDGVTLRYHDPVARPGTFHTVSLTGNISLIERQTVVRCHAIGTLDRNAEGHFEVLSGEVVSAEVLNIEFTLVTNDDIRLYRAHDARTGLDPWLHVEFGGGPLPMREDEPLEVLVPPPTATALPPKDPPPPAQELDIAEGDYLNHPTLGRCEVIAADGDERLTIRLESGRKVEVHLGLLDLTPMPADGSRRVFKVSIRRKRAG